MPNNAHRFVLGIDLGSASLGWALIRISTEGEPGALESCGVRIFDPGVDESDGSIERGADKSKNVARREARLHRRQLHRRAVRQRGLFELLQAHGLLPPRPPLGPGAEKLSRSDKSSLARHELLKKLDVELMQRWEKLLKDEGTPVPALQHVLPYLLRARALGEQIEPFELGRALYHLGQRRGFKSNRRESPRTEKQKEEKGKVKLGISELEKEMEAAGARTLGEFFSRLNPELQTLRRRWTARSMFETEFEEMWKAQSQHHSNLLNPILKKQVRHLLFFQRPIRSNAGLIGFCELEDRGQKWPPRRAPMACLAAQRFRLLQKVNDLRIVDANLNERYLTAEERPKLLDALEGQGDLKFSQIRELLRLPKRNVYFNLERGGEKKIPGNRTTSVMRQAFGEQWMQLASEKREVIIEQWRTIENPEALRRRAVQHWGLGETAGQLLADNPAEDGHCSLSRKALARILPLMEDGFPFKEAEKEVYGVRFSGGAAVDELPPVRKAVRELRNPAVERALTEVRKVVNAVVRRFGKPFEIHIELARDLKRSRKEREEIWKASREQQSFRAKAKNKICVEMGIPEPKRDDIEKALLHDECAGECPYTGKKISFSSLFGEHPQFDVEHILPLSRFPDNSIANKTLCYHEENRSVKRGRTPFEAYSGNEEKWDEILDRVKKWKNLGKLARFQIRTPEELEDFSARQLSDTRYSSKVAAHYLEKLYGGRDIREQDGAARRVIYSTSGKVTFDLRRNWELESILRDATSSGEKKGKPRSDHRHHAIDAIVIALTSQATVQALTQQAKRNEERGRASFRGLTAPWPNFVESIRPQIEQLNVSHRPEHKLSGALHKETNYGRPRSCNGETCVHVRKSISNPNSKLSAGDVENIVDPKVKEAVEQRLAELGGDLKKLQAAGVDPPFLTARDGRRIPIKSVRVREFLSTETIGEGPRQRHVKLANNHHVEIMAELDEKGRERCWEGHVVSLYEAMKRKRRKQPIVQQNHGSEDEYCFKFSLMGGDLVDFAENEKKQRYVVRTVSVDKRGYVKIEMSHTNDARKKKEIQKEGDWISRSPNELKKLNCQKVVVDVLGGVHPAND